jgi:nicotinamide-nucleotide amidase
MRAEIIAVGTEMTSGAKLDTNSQWLSLELSDLGIPVHVHTTLADDLQINIQALQIACDRSDIVLITGGLGPTRDDLTRDALAALAAVSLELHAPSLHQIEDFFRRRGREMPPRNRLQALFPAGSEPLTNPIGTAPGIWMTLSRAEQTPCQIAAMPGVPSEMKKMFFEQVRPRLQGSGRVIRRARINCYGLGESQAEELLGEMTARGHDPEIGITAHEATITLRIIAEGASEPDCLEKISRASAEIRQRLGDYVYGFEDEELEHVVVRELTERALTLASIECATRGLLAERISQVDGAAACYRSGLVVPTLSDSIEVAANRLREDSGADFLLVVGPEAIDTMDGQYVSTIPLGLFSEADRGCVMQLQWNGNPAITKSRAVKSALDLLRRQLGKPQVPHWHT